MPEPTALDIPEQIGHCHAAGGCRAPGTIAVTYSTAPIVGSRAAPGLVVTTGACPAHRSTVVGGIPVGATLLDVREIPLRAPVQPPPVGLDAVDRAPATEPTVHRVPRRRKRGAP